MTAAAFLTAIVDWSWTRWAACRGADPERFAPRSGWRLADRARAQAAARAYCATCPVREQCGATADQYRFDGIWGGSNRYTPADRQSYTVTPLLDGPALPLNADVDTSGEATG